MALITQQDLQNELNDIKDRFPRLKDDECFLAWFMKCFITDSENEAVQALVGGPKDKSLDAIHVDHPSKRVYLIQGKFREKLHGGTEKRTDVLTFANLVASFVDPEAMACLKRGLAGAALARVAEAEKALQRQGYRLQLFYVTTGRVSPALQTEARNTAHRPGGEATFEIFDGKMVMRLLSDYLDGVAPPVPELEFELENGTGASHGSVLQRMDREVNIESWVVPVTVSQIAKLYEHAGVRLFARNVRGFLGDTKINQNLRHTLEKEPAYFWYYNNGITIICDEASNRSQSGKHYLRIVNPQIINGQQTTRIVHEFASTGVRATVMVRVLAVPRRSEEEARQFEQLVSKIVAATNWQNEIKASDLQANDRRQIELERNLRKLDYQYLRKRQSKCDAKQHLNGVYRFQVTKEELAQASAACELDPQVLRLGKENLFGESCYTDVFPHSEAEHYLLRYWLGRLAARVSKGYPDRAYMKWLAVHFVWKRLSATLTRKARRTAFRQVSERGGFEHLRKALESVYKAIALYYRETSGSGETRIDIAGFFRLRGHHRKLEKFWEETESAHRDGFDRSWNRFLEELDAAENG